MPGSGRSRFGGGLSEGVDEFDAVVVLAVIEGFAVNDGGSETGGGGENECVPVADFMPIGRQTRLGDREDIDLEAWELD